MLLDSLEAALPQARVSDLSDQPLARRIFSLSEGLIGEIVTIVTKAAIAAIGNGSERVTERRFNELPHVPISHRRNSALHESLPFDRAADESARATTATTCANGPSSTARQSSALLGGYVQVKEREA